MQEFVFTSETAPSPSCHASTLLRLEDGTMLCAWFGGTRESDPDVEIYLSRRVNGEWSSPVMLSEGPGPHWNPVLFALDGGVGLFYKENRPAADGNLIGQWFTMFRFSTDGGLTWTPSRELVPGEEGGRGPVKNKCLRLSDGSILAPASHEDLPGELVWKAFSDRSTDEGKTWTSSAYIESDANLIQPSFWEPEPGHICALMRSDKGSIYRAESRDYGRTWEKSFATDMPNNNSGLDLTQVNGKIYLVCNPVNQNWGGRSPLTLYVSEDNGTHFEKVLDLETEPGFEFSYPAIITDGRRLYISYTWKRLLIRYAEIDL